MTAAGVRRAKAALSSGCKPHPAIGLIPIARRAISAARASAPFSIEMLTSIAGVGAVIIGATEEVG